MDQGQRPHLVIVQRATVAADTYNGEVRTWHELTRAYARVRYGSAEERRSAAQENAAQTATFEFDFTPTLAAALPTDRLYVFGTVWDIYSAVTVGANREVHITALANLDAEIDS